MQLSWIQCQGNVWCNLNGVNLAHSHFNNMDGVYIIWHGGPNAATVYVGQGNIRECLTFHRTDQRVQAYNGLGLFVTWASVQQAFRSGVEAYVSGRLQPLIQIARANIQPIEVNMPW